MNILFRCVKKNLKRAKDGFSNGDRDIETSWFGDGHLRTAVERGKVFQTRVQTPILSFFLFRNERRPHELSAN